MEMGVFLCELLIVKHLITKVFVFQYCVVGRISHEVGWKYQKVIATLEAKRKAKSNRYYETKKFEKVSIVVNTRVLQRVRLYSKRNKREGKIFTVCKVYRIVCMTK